MGDKSGHRRCHWTRSSNSPVAWKMLVKVLANNEIIMRSSLVESWNFNLSSYCSRSTILVQAAIVGLIIALTFWQSNYEVNKSTHQPVTENADLNISFNLLREKVHSVEEQTLKINCGSFSICWDIVSQNCKP